jgi:hypothetical protein
VTCGNTSLHGPRSPYCERCWTEHQRARNRAKVERWRRREEARAIEQPRGDGRRPTETDFAWLDSLELELGDPIRRAFQLIDLGRTTRDQEVMQLAVGALGRFDDLRAEFDQRAGQSSDPEGMAGLWRGFFESVREMYS